MPFYFSLLSSSQLKKAILSPGSRVSKIALTICALQRSPPPNNASAASREDTPGIRIRFQVTQRRKCHPNTGISHASEKGGGATLIIRHHIHSWPTWLRALIFIHFVRQPPLCSGLPSQWTPPYHTSLALLPRSTWPQSLTEHIFIHTK